MKSFDALFVELQPVLEELETLRKSIRKKNRKILFLGALIALFIVGIAFVWDAADATSLFIGFSIGLVIAATLYGNSWRAKANYRARVKREVIGALVQNAYENNLRYSPRKGIRKSDFQESNLFQQKIARYATEDRIEGKIGYTDLQVAEVHAQTQIRDNNGHKKYQSLFQGLFMIADFHKDFQGTTYVLPSTAGHSFGWLGRAFQQMNIRRGEVVRLENIDFEKAFVVYSNDQIEARYILTANMMERILALRARFNSNIQFAFKNNLMYLAIRSSYNHFEPKLNESLLKIENVQKFYAELASCLEIVEELNLNTRIWSKKD